MTKSPSVTYRHPFGGWTGKTAGGYLHERLGSRYVASGSIFHAGAISSDYTNPAAHPIGPPPPGLLDTTLSQARQPDYLLNLRAPSPHPIRDWRDGPEIHAGSSSSRWH